MKFEWHQRIFLYTLYLSWILYTFSLVAYFGYNLSGIYYLVDQILKIYISIVLIYKFNPYAGRGKFNEFDKILAYYAGLFLFITTVITNILIAVYGSFSTKVNNYLHYNSKLI